MSTKKKKLDSFISTQKAEANNTKVQKYFSRKRRKTIQIRIDEKWHARIKELATLENMVMSILLDRICKSFFKNYK